jgi:hypothetical protein
MSAPKSVEERMLAAAKKAGRERDAIQAMRDYQAEKARVDANTERLRALRLAKEAADAQAAAAQPVDAKPKRVRTRKSRTSN